MSEQQQTVSDLIRQRADLKKQADALDRRISEEQRREIDKAREAANRPQPIGPIVRSF
jgi:hypothetical protein